MPVLFLLDPYVTSIISSAMEQCLFILLGALSLTCIHLSLSRARAYVVAAAALSALQFVTRPEGAVFAAAAFLFLAYRRRFSSMFLYAVSTLIFMAPLLVYLKAHFGSILPQTMLVKTTDRHGHMPFTDLQTMSAFAKLALQVYGLPVALVVGLHLKYARDRFGLRRDDRLLLLFIVAALFLAYLGFLKERFISSRYLINFTPFLLVLLVLWIRDVPVRRVRNTALTAILIFFVILNIVSIPIRVQRGLSNAPALKEVGEWLRENTPPDASVHIWKIGYVGFYSERKIYDFNLLEKREGQENRGILVRRGDLSPLELARESGVDYVIRRNPPAGMDWELTFETESLDRGAPLRIYKLHR
ncbi:MAG: hypothetical protein KAW17_12650 [Candidatus Eisenbacteria sp.]|nr:hypothetical protein [Candidatus Eisenbacteria bacterium]